MNQLQLPVLRWDEQIGDPTLDDGGLDWLPRGFHTGLALPARTASQSTYVLNLQAIFTGRVGRQLGGRFFRT